MDILEFLHESPSPAWAAENAAKVLKEAGFSLEQSIAKDSGRAIYLRPQSGMLVAVKMPAQVIPEKLRFRIVGAHTDSPHLRLKPGAAISTNGHTTLASEIYGGALLYSWFDRELGIAGEIYFKQGDKIEHKLVKINKPIAIVPSLAIHLQRGVNEEGFVPAKAMGLDALITLNTAEFDFNRYLADAAEIKAEALLSYDLSLFDTCKAARGGAMDELLFSARLDNLVSCFAALTALKNSVGENTIQIVALFDHEEIGSVSESGAESAFLENLLHGIAEAYGLDQNAWRSALERSVFLSADMAHGVHPNFADKHDTLHRPKLGGGVTLKVNQNRRYATSAATQAIFHDLCKTHQIASQVYTHRNDLPCGSTIGPTVSARLGMATLDAGVAMLGMHSIRETCAYADIAHYIKFMKAFLNG